MPNDTNSIVDSYIFIRSFEEWSDFIRDGYPEGNHEICPPHGSIKQARLPYGGSSGSGSSRDELLAAVDVVRRARECRVAHDVNGQRGDVSRSDDAPDGQRRAELVAPLVQVVAEN